MTTTIRSSADGSKSYIAVGGTDRVTIDAATGAVSFVNDVTFSGLASRIKGDFSNAIVSNRLMFQSSTVNGVSYVEILPNGSARSSSIIVSNTSSDPSNTSFANLLINETEVRIQSGIRGTGSYLPIGLYTSSLERMRIAVDGNVGIGVAPKATWASTIKALEGPNNNAVIFGSQSTSLWSNLYNDGVGNKLIAAGMAAAVSANNVTGQAALVAYGSGVADSAAVVKGNFYVDSSGNALLNTPNGGLGYGPGAGGTVTQATSKSTSVTLNKPCGQITMNAASLAAGATVQFQLNNSILKKEDGLFIGFTSGVGNGAFYNVWWGGAGGVDGQAFVLVKNLSGSPLSEAIVLDFKVIKGATS